MLNIVKQCDVSKELIPSIGPQVSHFVIFPHLKYTQIFYEKGKNEEGMSQKAEAQTRSQGPTRGAIDVSSHIMPMISLGRS